MNDFKYINELRDLRLKVRKTQTLMKLLIQFHLMIMIIGTVIILFGLNYSLFVAGLSGLVISYIGYKECIE